MGSCKAKGGEGVHPATAQVSGVRCDDRVGCPMRLPLSWRDIVFRGRGSTPKWGRFSGARPPCLSGRDPIGCAVRIGGGSQHFCRMAMEHEQSLAEAICTSTTRLFLFARPWARSPYFSTVAWPSLADSVICGFRLSAFSLTHIICKTHPRKSQKSLRILGGSGEHTFLRHVHARVLCKTDD
jgi:hypothetical protein